MENLAHSFAKRSYGGNGFGTASHKSVYDDVFGGPPKFGMPTLAPRLEDYSEIFGGFHSARGTSIPILDLPVVDEGELCFDVRSSRLNYSEVFGGFDGLDFGLSLDDFVRKSNGRDESSDDDAWSPAESESRSGDTDPSAFSDWSQSLIVEDTHHPTSRQFDASSSKAGEKNNEKIANWASHVACSQDIPENAYLFGKNQPLQKVEAEKSRAASDLKSNMSFDGGTSENKKTIYLPVKIDFRKQDRDVGHVEKCREPFSNHIKPFVTVKDISLKTKPSHLPPPSRPPPVYGGKKGAFLKQHFWPKDDSSCSLENAEINSSPAFYDVEVDGSSSLSASATMRDEMEKAQAKIRSAKESIDQNVLQSCSKLQPQCDVKLEDENVNKTFESIDSYKDEGKATCAEERSRTVSIAEEKSKVFEMDQEILDSVKLERCDDFVEISTKRRSGKESGISFQIPHRKAQEFSWRQETDYFEVVETGIPFKAVEVYKDETKFVHEGSDDVKHWVVNETFELNEEVKDLNAAIKTPNSVDKKDKIKVTAEGRPNGMESETMSESSNQIVFPNVRKVELKSSESDTRKKEIKMTKNPEEIRKQNDSGKSEENQTKADMKVLEANHMQRRTRGKPGSAEVFGDLHTMKTNVRNPKEDLDIEESIERLCEAFVQAEGINQTERIMDERKKKDVSHEKQMNTRHKELSGSKEDPNMSREIFHLKENKKRPTELEENVKTSHKPFVEEENKENQELDGSPMISTEVDIEESSTLTRASTNSSTTFEAYKHHELSGSLEDVEQIKWDCEDSTVKPDELNHVTVESESIESFDGTDDLDNGGAPLSWELDRSLGMLERTEETVAHEEDQDLRTTLEESGTVKDVRVTDCPVKERPHSVNQDELHGEKNETGTFDVTNASCVNQHKNDSNEACIDIGNSSIKLDQEVSKRASQPDQLNVKVYEQGQRLQKTSGVEPNIHQGISNLTLYQSFRLSSANEKVTGASLTGRLGHRGMQLNSGKQVSQNVEEKEKIMNESEMEERLQREKEQEIEQLRKIEEEREREREREKDRMAVDRTTLETRDRLYVEARERAERAAVERAAAQARQRAMAEAREKMEKASLEARERSLADKASAEARLRAERAAVERATLEARQRAFEKAMAERVMSEGRERVERSVSDKFFTTSRTYEMRHSSSSNSGTSNQLRYSYSSVQFGNESESPQRCKARLERYRRTAERAAKALEEKNMRDLVAQREQAERNRLAETLDAEVKRWSSGKEGNLRALLSTLQYILGAESGWQPIPLTEVITSAAVKKAYRKATLCVHPDKLQQRGASIQHKYICEKVFDLLKEAWNTFNSEER